MIDVDPQVAESFERLHPTPDVVTDWEDVLVRSARPVRFTGQSRPPREPWPWRPRRALLLLGAATVVAAVVALAITAPWRGGPSILDRAAAAIADPTSTQILEERIVFRSGPFPGNYPQPVDPALPRLRGKGGHGSVHLWLDGAPPHRFRMTSVTWCPPSLRGFQGCLHTPQRSEIGGRLGGVLGLSYDSASGALYPAPIMGQLPSTRVSRSTFDPVPFIKAALASGRAQLDGRATILGQEVIRIRINANRSGHGEPVAFYYADARSYRPVRITIPEGPKPAGSMLGLPLVGGPEPAFTTAGTLDFLEYRYLPPTKANRKLTDIRAQHPHAKIL